MVKADQAWDRLCRAVKINNKERVEELLDLHHRAGDINCPALAADHNGWTLLILAASRGHWELVNTFIRIGIGVNRIANKGTTALHECAATKDGERGVKVAEDKRFFLSAILLLEAGANPWQETARGLTAVEVAAAANNVGLKNILESKAFFAGKLSLPRKGHGSKLYQCVVAPRCPPGEQDLPAGAFPLWMYCYKAEKDPCEEAFRIPLANARLRASRLQGDNAAFLVLAPGKMPPKKLTQSGNAADGFVIELKPARGDSQDLLAKLVDLVTMSGGFTDWDAIQRQLTSKQNNPAGTANPQLITISAQAQAGTVPGLPAPHAAAQGIAHPIAATATGLAQGLRLQPHRSAAAETPLQPLQARGHLAREPPAGLHRIMPRLSASEPDTSVGSSARGSSSAYPGTLQQLDETASGHSVSPSASSGKEAAMDATFAQHWGATTENGGGPRYQRAPAAVEQWVQPPPALPVPWSQANGHGRGAASPLTQHRQPERAELGSATPSRVSLANSELDSISESMTSDFGDVSLRGMKQPTRAQPNPAQQGDMRELDVAATPAPVADDDDDDDWMAEYQAALAAGKFEMTEYEKMVQAQQLLNAKKLQHPGPHKAASEPAMNMPAYSAAGSLPESTATSRLAHRPSAPPALMDDDPDDLPTRASLPVGSQRQAPAIPARRPRDDFEDSLSCPITQELMKDPVLLLGDGQSYERAAIELWLRDHDTSPMTGAKLESEVLQPNFALRSIISAFRAE